MIVPHDIDLKALGCSNTVWLSRPAAHNWTCLALMTSSMNLVICSRPAAGFRHACVVLVVFLLCAFMFVIGQHLASQKCTKSAMRCVCNKMSVHSHPTLLYRVDGGNATGCMQPWLVCRSQENTSVCGPTPIAVWRGTLCLPAGVPPSTVSSHLAVSDWHGATRQPSNGDRPEAVTLSSSLSHACVGS